MTEKFNIKTVHDAFLSSTVDDDDVDLKEYLVAFEELNKFCNLMGVIFSFVSKDLRLKMDILSQFITNPKTSDSFRTAKTMVVYEKDGQLLNSKNYVSGSRTLLRLHRGLDFIREFLQSVANLKDSDNTSAVCRAAYDNTLSKHHTFMVRNGAKLAMHTMPNRGELLIKLCGPSIEDIQLALDSLPKMLETASQVFERIEKLYTLHDLHSLP